VFEKEKSSTEALPMAWDSASRAAAVTAAASAQGLTLVQ